MASKIPLCFALFMFSLVPLSACLSAQGRRRYLLYNTSQLPTTENLTTYEQPILRDCSPNVARTRDCNLLATRSPSNDDGDIQDLKFFRRCISKLFCFEFVEGVMAWANLPSFNGYLNQDYFKNTAKRVERFFIRNNDWSQTLAYAPFREVIHGKYPYMLDIVAARYLYMVYVLNLLKGDWTFKPCATGSEGKLIVPKDGVCFLVPRDTVTSTSEFDLALLGQHSGSLTAQFNQFFTEPLGSRNIPGFGKGVQNIFDASVQAFTLEYAMPELFNELSTRFENAVIKMNDKISFVLQEVVTAILKMKTHNSKYSIDLLSDQIVLKDKATKNNLPEIFETWIKRFQHLNDAVENFKDTEYYLSFGLQGRHRIAYDIIVAMVDHVGLAEPARSALIENAIALMFAPEAYHTRGSVRHVVKLTKMIPGKLPTTTVENHRLSMLENWAHAIAEHTRHCVKYKLPNIACLPKMSKYLWRMTDAMHQIYTAIPGNNNGLAIMDNAGSTGIRSILYHWLETVKRKGLPYIPNDEKILNPPTTNIHYFYKTFNCPVLMAFEELTTECLDAIQAEIRKYNRRLFHILVEINQ